MEKESMTRAREWLARNYPNLSDADERLAITAFIAGAESVRHDGKETPCR